MVGLLLLVVVLVAIDMFKTIREYEVSELTRKGGKDCRDHHQP